MLDVLEIRHVATGAQDGKVGHLVQTLNVAEAGQGSVRGQVIGRHHDAALVLESQH